MKDDEIRILMLEDNPTDAELVEHELRKGGIVFQSKRVETREDFISQLEEFTPQVILADYKLPAFDGITAFTISKEKGLEVPFIIVSGTLGEDLAVETLKSGVTDYILKSNLNRLVPSVNRALAETKLQTERKQAEEALKESERFLKTIISSVAEGVIVYDRQLRYKVWNKFMEDVTGLKAQEVLEKYALDLFPHLQTHGVRLLLARALKGETVYSPDTPYYIPKTERTGWVIGTYSPQVATDGEIVGVVGIIRDITERKRAEEVLQESEERYRILIENINLGITLIGTDYRIVVTNTGQTKLFNKPPSAFRGKQCFREFEKRSEVCSHCPGTIAMATGHAAEAETTGIRDDGSSFSVHIHAFPIFGKNGKISGFVEVIEETTERKQAEEQMLSLQSQLQQSQKMEAIGQLAGGVAHDFNNLLTVISVQSQLALRGLREGDPLKEKLKDIELAADRAANLTRQLLAFSRRQILEMKVINLNVILQDMEKMLRRVIGEDIELKTILADDLGLVKVDPGQMEQVIVNLAVNAKDAMPQGGKLFLETANAELDEEYVHSHAGMIPGAYVMLSITDTGTGMTKEVKEQIFDPFFTTKEKGKGTGLGLSTVYGIVKQSGGDIYVYSEPGKGTTFKVYLPQVFEPQEEFKKVTSEEIPRGKETILVVEDDRMVRRLAVDILRRQGYRVLEATEGGEALVMCEKEKEAIALILTDIVMPHMSGPELIERLKQVRKDFKVLYMTGYTDESIVQHGILEEGINLIHKPFTIDKLARKVRGVLDNN
jgi:two-component system, cell cycle sensor histidine kinase and response regulator CckA